MLAKLSLAKFIVYSPVSIGIKEMKSIKNIIYLFSIFNFVKIVDTLGIKLLNIFTELFIFSFRKELKQNVSFFTTISRENQYYIYSKENYIYSKENYIYSKENYIYRSCRMHSWKYQWYTQHQVHLENIIWRQVFKCSRESEQFVSKYYFLNYNVFP